MEVGQIGSNEKVRVVECMSCTSRNRRLDQGALFTTGTIQQKSVQGFQVVACE